MARWEAASTRELDEVSGLLHDAWFDFDTLEHDVAAGTLSVAFAQDWNQSPPFEGDAGGQDVPPPEVVAKTWRYTEERVPFMRGSLRIMHVESAKLDPAAGDAAMLLGISYDEAAGQITVEGVSGNQVAAVKRLQVVAELRPDEVALYVRRRRGLMGESEVPLWDLAP